MKYLIAGLGNIGSEYQNTRHNIGFMIMDALLSGSSSVFADGKLGAMASMRLKNKTMLLLKPNTYMNLSGKSVRYWLQKEKIPLENLLIITDDLALPEGKLRLKPKGSDGGHNGLKSIQELLGSTQYARLRFGIGKSFEAGRQVQYVLNPWSAEELENLQPSLEMAREIISSFVLAGVQKTMNTFNGKT